jgi:hypothetical protein
LGLVGDSLEVKCRNELNYIMAFDEDFAKKAQVHIFDFAKNKSTELPTGLPQE